jgi:CRISPR-associated protein Cas6
MPVIEIHFPLTGNTIPVDHSYMLYSAISRLIPEIHENPHIGLHPVNGNLTGNRELSIGKNSRLKFRLPTEAIPIILPIAGKTLSIKGNSITVGVPLSTNLIPAANLYSRLVIIKGFMEPESFLDAVKRQLESLEINGIPSLIEQFDICESNRDNNTGTRSPYLRRTIRVRDKEIVGFAVKVNNLTAEESIRLQEEGIGGRRRFGCGLFVPLKGE